MEKQDKDIGELTKKISRTRTRRNFCYALAFAGACGVGIPIANIYFNTPEIYKKLEEKTKIINYFEDKRTDIQEELNNFYVIDNKDFKTAYNNAVNYRKLITEKMHLYANTIGSLEKEKNDSKQTSEFKEHENKQKTAINWSSFSFIAFALGMFGASRFESKKGKLQIKLRELVSK